MWKRNVLDRAATVLWALEQNAVNEMYIFENSVMEKKRTSCQIITDVTDNEMTFDSQVKKLLKTSS